MSDDLLKEARSLIDGGNKAVTAFLVSAFVWWISNLFPISLNEQPDGSAVGRVSALNRKAQEMDDSCAKVIHIARGGEQRFVSDSCRVNLLENDSDDSEINSKSSRIAQIEHAIAVSRDDYCRSFMENLEAAVAKCKDNKIVYENASREAAKSGGLDILGLKINEIHPRWHPLVLVMIFFFGAMWIGARRRRIFRHLYDYTCLAGFSKEKMTPLLLTMPWWLWPIPNWSNPDGHALRIVVASRSETWRGAKNSVLMLVLILAIAFSALILQDNLSILSGGGIRRAVSVAWSLFGHFIPDLAFLGAVFGLGGFFYIWSGLPRNGSGLLMTARRRAVKQLFLGGTAAVTVGAVVGLSTDRNSASVMVESARSQLRWKRRNSHAKKYVSHSGPPGWYIQAKDAGHKQVAYFVLPALDQLVEHEQRLRPKKQKTKSTYSDTGFMVKIRRRISAGPYNIHRPANTIRSLRGTLPSARWAAMNPESGAIADPKDNQRMSRSFYSEGVEYTALQLWTSGKKQDALRALMIGIAHAAHYPKARANIRLFDLAAALYARAGQYEELNTIASRLTDLTTPLTDTDRLRTQQRTTAWLDPASSWRRKWLSDPGKSKSWGGVDI